MTDAGSRNSPVRPAKKLPNPHSFTIVMCCIAAAFLIGGVLLITLSPKPAAHGLGIFLFFLGAFSILPVFRVRSRR